IVFRAELSAGTRRAASIRQTRTPPDSQGRGVSWNGARGGTAGDDRKMNNEPLEREPIDRMRARLEALLKAHAAPRCGACSKRTGKACQGAAMPNGRCKLHGGKSTGPRTPEGLESAAGGQIGSTGTFRGKPRRNGRACGRQYLRSAG